jgi:hypothetical protein
MRRAVLLFLGNACLDEEADDFFPPGGRPLRLGGLTETLQRFGEGARPAVVSDSIPRFA